MNKTPYVYILANKQNGTLYVGVTSDLIKRIWQHKNKSFSGFTAKHNINKLVYYEQHFDMLEAIKREKMLKRLPRKWKLILIQKDNPNWIDLYEKL